MSKELEALKKIRELCGKEIVEACWLPNAIDYTKTITINDYCDIIETALKRLAKYERDWLKHHDEFNKKAIAIEIIKKNVNVKQLIMATEMNGVLGSELELLKEVLL